MFILTFIQKIMNQRPRADESEEDLLRFQAEFLAKKSSPSAPVKKADKRKAPGGSGSSTQGGLETARANVTKDVVTLPGKFFFSFLFC